VYRTYPAGRHNAVWPGDGDAEARPVSGIYFLRMDAGGVSATGKVLLIR